MQGLWTTNDTVMDVRMALQIHPFTYQSRVDSSRWMSINTAIEADDNGTVGMWCPRNLFSNKEVIQL